MTRPVRIQLSRQKGFDLQAASRALNGLPAKSVARPHPHGNPFRTGMGPCGCPSPAKCSHADLRRAAAQKAVEDFRAIPRSEKALARIRAELGGYNLGCWCSPGDPCHADVLLELANP